MADNNCCMCLWKKKSKKNNSVELQKQMNTEKPKFIKMKSDKIELSKDDTWNWSYMNILLKER
jgi:hypothetical protein